MIRKYLPQSTEALIHWYERYLSPISLLIGFVLDNFVVLKRVDAVFGNILLLSYLILAAIAIVVLNVVETGRVQNRAVLWIAPFIPVAIQFFFGGLFSGYLSLYSRSAGVIFSWLFVIVLAGLLLGNERFRALYQRLPFQISIYFASLYSFLIFFLPLIFKAIGPVMFLVSGALSVGIISLFMIVLRALIYERYMETRRTSLRSLTVIIVLFNVLYFTNLIPPLPLAIKEAGVYHAVTRTENVYTLEGERKNWATRFFSAPARVQLAPGEKAYIFTAVFAPSGLSTALRHQWQYFNTTTKMWETRSDVMFTIYGGRDGGFRGYSEKMDPEVGSWRVNVLTEHGQIVGRVHFTVVRPTGTVEMIEETR